MVSWTHFNSKLYPYAISQPSSFRHIVLSVDGQQSSDYFSPGLGSYTTNVNISASRGPVVNVARDLKERDGVHVRASGAVAVLGRQMTLTRADFRGLAGTWVEEQLSFAAGGYSWRLTASYDTRYKRMRSTMLKMLQSFRLHPLPARSR